MQRCLYRLQHLQHAKGVKYLHIGGKCQFYFPTFINYLNINACQLLGGSDYSSQTPSLGDPNGNPTSSLEAPNIEGNKRLPPSL